MSGLKEKKEENEEEEKRKRGRGGRSRKGRRKEKRRKKRTKERKEGLLETVLTESMLRKKQQSSLVAGVGKMRAPATPTCHLPVLCSRPLLERSSVKKIGTSSSKHTRLYF